MLCVQCGPQAASTPSTQARRAMQQGGLHSRMAGVRAVALLQQQRGKAVLINEQIPGQKWSTRRVGISTIGMKTPVRIFPRAPCEECLSWNI